ncbi:hypothetical protein MHIB_15340 [Mycolicibacter hiberniae]|uniref:Uncharacterized protein n=1 Tax=Mycolicibacter hiberniae TaxID=29314 RepID=A0A7I7X030_9MYCO|nr:hypothetical protein MHIB_15340 [Mycolicibacter hiberniae]
MDVAGVIGGAFAVAFTFAGTVIVAFRPGRAPILGAAHVVPLLTKRLEHIENGGRDGQCAQHGS